MYVSPVSWHLHVGFDPSTRGTSHKRRKGRPRWRSVFYGLGLLWIAFLFTREARKRNTTTQRALYGLGNIGSKSATTRSVVAFDKGNSSFWENPVPAELFPQVEELWLMAATVEDQRTTWQEGSRTPFFVRALVYQHDMHYPEGYNLGSYLLRVNATFGKKASQKPVRCRPFSTHSNQGPNKDVIKHTHDTAYGVRIECDIPESIADVKTGPPKSLDVRLSFQAIRYSDTSVQNRLAELARKEGPTFEYPSELLSRADSPSLAFSLREQHMPHTRYTICSQPIRDYESFIGDKIPKRIIEWRLYWDELGVKRVVWYGYRDEPRWIAFLERFLGLFDNYDQIILVDEITGGTRYYDQTMWYNYCGFNFRKATDYLIIFDIDEIVALKPSAYSAPAAAFSTWIDSWKPQAGSYCMLRQDLAMSASTFESVKKAGGPSLELLAQDLWTAISHEPWAVSQFKRKSIHRSLAPQEIWTHWTTWQFPLPIEKDEPLPNNSERDLREWPKPYHKPRPTWEIEWWHQNVSNVVNYFDMWPRAYHYRYWKGREKYQVGKPLPTHRNLQVFQKTLRERIANIVRLLTADEATEHGMA